MWFAEALDPDCAVPHWLRLQRVMNVAAKWHMPSPHFDSLCPGMFTDCNTVALILSATHFLLLLRNCESNQSKRAERFVLLTSVWHTALLRLERDLYVFEHPIA